MFPMNASYLTRQEQEYLLSLHSDNDAPRYGTLKSQGGKRDPNAPEKETMNAIDNAPARKCDVDFGQDEIPGTRARVKRTISRITEPMDPLRKGYGSHEPIRQSGSKKARCRCPDCVELRSRGRPRSPTREGESEMARRNRKIDEFRKSGRNQNGGWDVMMGEEKTRMHWIA